MAATAPGVRQRIEALGPWFYEFDLGEYGRTASVLPPEILPIHQTRLDMVNRVVDGYFGDRARQIRPDYFDAHYNFALVCQELDRLEEASHVYRELLLRQPAHPEAHNNLGNVQLALGNSKEARVSYQQAVHYYPMHHEANWNLGLADLLHGDFATGWAGYEWRLRGATAAVLPISGQRC